MFGIYSIYCIYLYLLKHITFRYLFHIWPIRGNPQCYTSSWRHQLHSSPLILRVIWEGLQHSALLHQLLLTYLLHNVLLVKPKRQSPTKIMSRSKTFSPFQEILSLTHFCVHHTLLYRETVAIFPTVNSKQGVRLNIKINHSNAQSPVCIFLVVQFLGGSTAGEVAPTILPLAEEV